jgi:hypothetical protein
MYSSCGSTCASNVPGTDDPSKGAKGPGSGSVRWSSAEQILKPASAFRGQVAASRAQVAQSRLRGLEARGDLLVRGARPVPGTKEKSYVARFPRSAPPSSCLIAAGLDGFGFG